MDELIKQKEEYYEKILKSRENIANSRYKLAGDKPKLWEEATGLADQKKDYVKSEVAIWTEEIEQEEAKIEYYYNMINIINDKMMLMEYSNE